MNQSDLEKELEREIYTNRMLVLLEMEGGFAQVMFTDKHFKAVSDAIAKGFPLLKKEGEYETLDMQISDELIPIEPFDGMRDYYEKDEFEA